MKAMVLAAGLGERMRPLTETRAKPSLPLLNRPIIIHTLAYLKRQGIDEAVINLHHQPESIRGLVGDGSRLGLKVHYSEEQVILGTAGGLKKAEPMLKGSGPFVMINSDFVTDCDLRAVVEAHTKAHAVATMVLTPRTAGTQYGVVEVGESGRITSIAGRSSRKGARGASGASDQPRSDGAHGFTFTGIHILEPSIFASIQPGVKFEINSEVYPALLEKDAVIMGFVHQGAWMEMGTPRLYLDGSLRFLGDGMDASLTPIKVGEGIYIDQVTLPASTITAPPVLVGRGTTFATNCSLQGGVVIGRQCRIGQGCALRSTILWDGARLGDRVQLTDCIVTSGVFVPPQTSLSGRILFRVDGYQGSKDHLERVGSSWAARLV